MSGSHSPEAQLPRVIAVIPTFNRRELVGEVLEAVRSQSAPVTGVVLVDNGSSDDTGAFLGERGHLDDPRVELVRLDENAGFSGAFRVGIERALARDPEWIWALDDDAVPDSKCLENLLSAAEHSRDRTVGALMSYQLHWSGGTMNYRFPRTVVEALRHGYGRPLTGVEPGDPVMSVDWFTTACVLMAATAVRRVGLPRNDLFYYADPLEYSLRLREAGYSALLVPTSLVDHRSEAAPGKTMPGWRWYYVYRNTIFVLRTRAGTLGRRVQVASTVRMTLGGLARMLGALWRREWRLAGIVGRGIVDGYLGRLGRWVMPGGEG